MKPAACVVAVLTLATGCGGARAWNFDETDRISDVMDRRGEDPSAVARERSVLTRDMPQLADYTRPVFVRPSRDTQRRPAVKGKRPSAASAERLANSTRPRRLAAGDSPASARTAARAAPGR